MGCKYNRSARESVPLVGATYKSSFGKWVAEITVESTRVAPMYLREVPQESCTYGRHTIGLHARRLDGIASSDLSTLAARHIPR